MIRRAMAGVGQWIEALVSPAPQVQFGVANSQSSVSAAADAAGTGPEAASTTPHVPASGQPDPYDQAESVRELILMHAQTYELPFTISCNCGAEWRYGGPEDHSAHVADLVANQLRADSRMALATNKFRK